MNPSTQFQNGFWWLRVKSSTGDEVDGNTEDQERWMHARGDERDGDHRQWVVIGDWQGKGDRRDGGGQRGCGRRLVVCTKKKKKIKRQQTLNLYIFLTNIY